MNRQPENFTPDLDVFERPALRRRERPYLFAYDITEPKRARTVLRCLRRWRIDGQLSVHETFLSPDQAEEVACELLDYIDPGTDRLLVARLSQRGLAPVFFVSRLEPGPPVIGLPGNPWPVRFQSGWYLLAYDIRDDRRLRCVHKVSSRICARLQRSVYLYHGGGRTLMRLLETLNEVVDHGLDDVRLYAVQNAAALWFACGPRPPVSALYSGDALERPHSAIGESVFSPEE